MYVETCHKTYSTKRRERFRAGNKQESVVVSQLNIFGGGATVKEREVWGLADQVFGLAHMVNDHFVVGGANE